MMLMKRVLLAMLFALPLAACDKDGPAEELGENVDSAAENTRDTVSDAGERMGDNLEEAGERISD